jgi:hypothetical protein
VHPLWGRRNKICHQENQKKKKNKKNKKKKKKKDKTNAGGPSSPSCYWFLATSDPPSCGGGRPRSPNGVKPIGSALLPSRDRGSFFLRHQGRFRWDLPQAQWRQALQGFSSSSLDEMRLRGVTMRCERTSDAERHDALVRDVGIGRARPGTPARSPFAGTGVLGSRFLKKNGLVPHAWRMERTPLTRDVMKDVHAGRMRRWWRSCGRKKDRRDDGRQHALPALKID